MAKNDCQFQHPAVTAAYRASTGLLVPAGTADAARVVREAADCAADMERNRGWYLGKEMDAEALDAYSEALSVRFRRDATAAELAEMMGRVMDALAG